MKIYLTDGSIEGLYTALYYAKGDCLVTSGDSVQLTLDSEVITIQTQSGKADIMYKKIGKIDQYAAGDVDLLFRSCNEKKEQIAADYLMLILSEKRPVRKMLHHPVVIQVNDIIGKVTGEAHNMKGFLRFIETAGGAMYGAYAPDNDVTDLVMPHFIARFGKIKFVIHDLNRKKAALYDGKEWFTANVGEAEVYLSEYEKAFEGLWKKYYASVNIKERPHEKQMKGYMPVRYWKYMSEKN